MRLKKINQKTIFYELLLIILLKLVLDYSYIYISNNINISNLFSFNFYLPNYLIGWGLTFIIYGILIYKRDINIFTIFLLLYILYVLPNLVYYSFENIPLKHLILLLSPYIFIVLSMYNFNYIIKNSHIIKPKYIVMVCYLLLIIVLIHLIWASKGDFVIDVTKVYEFREKYDSIGSSGLWAYINSWTFRIFALFVLAWAFYKKNILLVFFTIGFITLFYMFTGHKSIFVSMFIVFFFLIIAKLKWNTILVIGLFILFFSSIIIFSILSGDIWVNSILIRRVLFVPAVNNFAFFDFFSNNEFIYWSNGILKSFFEYPYEKNIALLIGEYLDLPNTYANTGFVPMGYAHAGYFGTLIYTIIAAIILNIINNFITDEMKFVKISIVFLPIFIFFTTSDLLTTFLTHGLFIGMILLILISIKNEKNKILERK